MGKHSLESLAIIAYVAYGNNRNWKTHDGKPMPQWDHISKEIQVAWMTAANSIVQTVHDDTMELFNKIIEHA